MLEMANARFIYLKTIFICLTWQNRNFTKSRIPKKKKNRLTSHRMAKCLLSMETVLELAEGLGVPVDEGEYSTRDAYEADEAFISSTRHCMLPVATMNGLRVGTELPGPVTRRLLEAWRELVQIDFVRQALDASRP